jgi:hypothetical protein
VPDFTLKQNVKHFFLLVYGNLLSWKNVKHCLLDTFDTYSLNGMVNNTLEFLCRKRERSIDKRCHRKRGRSPLARKQPNSIQKSSVGNSVKFGVRRGGIDRYKGVTIQCVTLIRS